MLDIQTKLARLKRPALLARAARFGVDEYRRATHLPRLLGTDDLPKPAAALMRLFEIEDEMNKARWARLGGYSAGKHVDALIAIAGEARLMRTTQLQIIK